MPCYVCKCTLSAANVDRVQPYYEDPWAVIYNADCLELIPDLAFDVVVTDPPYGIGWEFHGGGVGESYRGATNNGIANDDDTAARDSMLNMIGTKPAAVFGAPLAAQPTEAKQALVWKKAVNVGVVGSTIGYRRDIEMIYVVGDWPRSTDMRSSVLESPECNTAQKSGHPHAKPVDLMRELIEAVGPGVILDPFMGSGSTLRAAKDLGRKAIGIELEERYCETAALRLAQDCLQFG